MIQNITTPFLGKLVNDILEEIKESNDKGLFLNLIRTYQIKYGNGSWSENVLIPYIIKDKLTNIIIVNHPKDAERLANIHIKKMSNLKPFVFDSIISTTNNSNWKEQRCEYQSAFSLKNKLEKIIPISHRRAKECIETLWILSQQGNGEVNINDFLLNETLAQLQLAMFGFSNEFEQQNNKQIRNMFSNYDITNGKNIVKNILNQIKESNGPISEILNKRINKNKREDVGNALIFSYAGHDTTGNTLSFLIYELCRNPMYQTKLRNEIDIFWLEHKNEEITYNDFRKLPFMTRCIMETLRLWPALANGTYRELTKDDFVIGNDGEKIKISKGTFIQIPNWFRHRNPELWGVDANIFNPERDFIDEELWDGTIINTYNPSTERFSPFTYGPRDCIGKNFSQIEMRLILLYIIHSYEFELTERQSNIKDEYFLYNRFTCGPRNINNKSEKDSSLGLYVNIKKLYNKSKL